GRSTLYLWILLWRPSSCAASERLTKSVAAVRSTGLRLLHFSYPEDVRGYQPCRYRRYHYRIVMISKGIFLRGFCLRQVERGQLYYYNIATGVVAFKHDETGIQGCYQMDRKDQISA